MKKKRQMNSFRHWQTHTHTHTHTLYPPSLSHTLKHTLFLWDLSLFMSLIMPWFSGFSFWCVIVFLEPFRWFSSFLSNVSWTHTTAPPPPPNTHFTSSIPFGTNDAMLCICLIFSETFLCPLDSSRSRSCTVRCTSELTGSRFLLETDHNRLCVRRASHLLICFEVCLSYSSMCACVCEAAAESEQYVYIV